MADFLGLAIFRPTRRIGEFTAQVTIEESHRDRLSITDHPIESTGTSSVTDHAFMLPAEVVIRCGWSGAFSLSNLQPTDVSETYAKILSLQASREPFDIVTGKRRYQNMLIQDISVTTDATTETTLMVTLTCRQVILVETQTTDVPANAVHKTPQKTEAVQDTGTKQVKEVSFPQEIVNFISSALGN